MIPVYFAIFIYGLMAYGTASVILKGGCGKNGSTVAVRKKKYWRKFFQMRFSVDSQYFLIWTLVNFGKNKLENKNHLLAVAFYTQNNESLAW